MALDEVDFGDLEAVGGGGHLPYAFVGGGAAFGGVVEEADGVISAASNTAAELVELGDAEVFGFADHDDGGVGDVDADFDDGGGYEDVEVAVGELAHGGVFVGVFELAVEEADAVVFEFGFAEVLVGFEYAAGAVDAGADDVDLVALVDVFAHDFVGAGGVFGEVFGDDVAFDGSAAAGEFVEGGVVEVAEEGHGDGAGYGGGGHDEEVGGGVVFAFGAEAVALFDAEAVLFVDDDESEVEEFDGVLDEGVGADDDVGVAGDDGKEGVVFLGGGHVAGEGGDGEVDAGVGEEFGEAVSVLVGEDGGGGEEGALFAVFDGLEHGYEGDDGFAGADFALEEALHGVGGVEVGGDGVDDGLLAGGESVWEVVDEGFAVVGGAGGVGG